MPEASEFAGCERSHSIDGGIAGVDVVMMLRIQKERMATAQIPDADRYFAKFGLSAERLAKAKPDAIVMHPQPMNRGIEIASDVADGPQSVIRDQVRNGVAVRMAVLEAVIEGRKSCAPCPTKNPGAAAACIPRIAAASSSRKARSFAQETWPGEQFVLRISAPQCAARAHAGQLRAPHLRSRRAHAPAAVHPARRCTRGLDRDPLQDRRARACAP